MSMDKRYKLALVLILVALVVTVVSFSISLAVNSNGGNSQQGADNSGGGVQLTIVKAAANTGTVGGSGK